MKFFRLLLDNLNRMSSVIVSLTILAGIFNGLILLVINKSVERGLQFHRIPLAHLLMFLACLVLFVYCKRYALQKGSSFVEGIIKKIRLKIVEKVRQTELLPLERIRASRIFSIVSAETVVITEATSTIINACSGLVMLLFSFIYLWTLSSFAFYLCLSFFLFNLLILFLDRGPNGKGEGGPENGQGEELFSSLHHILYGQRELKMNSAKRKDLLENHFERYSDQDRMVKTERNLAIETVNLRTLSFLYFLLGGIVFILPSYSSVPALQLIKLTSAVLFMMGPIESLLQAWPALLKAEMALERLSELEKALDLEGKASLSTSTTSSSLQGVLPLEFTRIDVRDLTFHYQGKNQEESFSIGPVNLNLQRGEVIFIVGGNGQGKSTFLKVLSGLYFPHQGGIFIDGQRVHKGLYPAYRQYFSAIFADFYLFDRPECTGPLDPLRVESLLVEMQLREKTAFEGGKFTDLNLSTGQRKRLAYLIASLENKSIYVFDEWAADQDPQFRRYFYEVLLQDLKQRGKTVVVVTHDDHYFHVADRVVTMEYGRIR